VVRGKHRGILLAFSPYFLAAMLPPLAVSLVTGPHALLWPLFWSALIVSVGHFMAAVGVQCSGASASGWGSLCSTLLLGAVIVFALVLLPIGLAAVGLMMFYLLGTGGNLPPAFFQMMGTILPPALFLGYAITAVLLGVMTDSFLVDAERRVRPAIAPERLTPLKVVRTTPETPASLSTDST
jgi:hypothetical protein